MWKAGYADNPLQTTLDVSFPNHLMQPSYFSLEKTEDREGKAEQLTSVQVKWPTQARRMCSTRELIK